MNSNWEPSRIEQKIGINFKYDRTLRLAMIHPSHAKLIEEPEIDNSRLVLLGKAILDLALAEYIYHNFSHFAVGKQKALCEKLTESDRLTNLWFDLQLGDFYPFLNLKEERHRLRVKENNPFAKACKALIGAIYLDRGFSQTRNWLQKRLIVPSLQRYLKPDLEPSVSDKQQQFLGGYLLQALAIDYVYHHLPLASPNVLKSQARTITAKESRQEYLQLSQSFWSQQLTDTPLPKSYKLFLAQVFLKLNEENSKSSLSKIQTYFARDCVDEDEIMTQAIALLLKEGKSQKWIIHKVMSYPSNQYNDGREKYHKLTGFNAED